MIGGIIFGVVRKPSSILINVGGIGSDEGREMAIEIGEDYQSLPYKMLPGDAIWWQGKIAFWTPHENKNIKSGNDGGTLTDIRLRRLE